LLLPGLLREKAGLKGDVAVVGKLERLDVRIAEDYRKEVEENPFTPEDDEALAKLGIW
jgi:DNA-binding transcriptional regulator/RsmH inhibitor MraZ